MFWDWKMTYRIRPNYRPCPYNRPPLTFYFIFTYYCPLDDLFLTFYFIFTYYRPLDDLLALVVENKFMLAPWAPIRSNTVFILAQTRLYKPMTHTRDNA